MERELMEIVDGEMKNRGEEDPGRGKEVVLALEFSELLCSTFSLAEGDRRLHPIQKTKKT